MSIQFNQPPLITYSTTFVDPEERARSLRARAPGLSGTEIDRLLRDAWVAGFHEGERDGHDKGYRDGERDGRNGASRRGREKIEKVINAHFNHVVRELRMDRRRTTIAAEREWMDRQAKSVETAIKRLTDDSEGAL